MCTYWQRDNRRRIENTYQRLCLYSYDCVFILISRCVHITWVFYLLITCFLPIEITFWLNLIPPALRILHINLFICETSVLYVIMTKGIWHWCLFNDERFWSIFAENGLNVRNLSYSSWKFWKFVIWLRIWGILVLFFANAFTWILDTWRLCEP